MRPIVIILLLAATAVLGSCGGHARSRDESRVTETRPDGTTVVTERRIESEVRTPPNPVSPGTAEAGSRGASASTGNQAADDQALAQLAWMPWAGVAMIAVGALSIIGRAWLPVLAILPLGASWALIAAGAGLLVLPLLLDRYSAWILFALLGGVALAVAWGMGLFDNIRTRLHPRVSNGVS